ncbi:MAG: hypothetical protein OXG15_10260 [Gammaproteobacteria bacterium]|nr:hypothetical protein [Gammaproteobacteria bacterium]
MKPRYALLASVLLCAFTTSTSAEEAPAKDVNVLGIFDQIGLQEARAKQKTKTRPVLRVSRSVAEQSLKSLLTAEPEEVRSIQPGYQPVHLNPLFDHPVIKSPRNVLNSSREASCRTMIFTGPTRANDGLNNVKAEFLATGCSTGNGQNGKWTAYTKLIAPGGNWTDRNAVKNGAWVDFCETDTRISLGYEQGEWFARVNLYVQRSGDWWARSIYTERRRISF